MIEITPLDGIVLGIFVAAIARGVWIGLIRESFSIAALGGACIAVRFATVPVSQWVTSWSEGRFGPTATLWVAGALISIIAVATIAIVGRIMRRGAQAAGLGWADRLGGAALGGAEGLIVVALLLLATTWALGTDHPALADSQSVEMFEDVQSYVLERSPSLPNVAAGPES